MAGKLMNELILAINGAADRDLVFDPFDVIDLLDEREEDSDVGVVPYAATYWNHVMVNVYKVTEADGSWAFVASHHGDGGVCVSRQGPWATWEKVRAKYPKPEDWTVY